MNKLIVIAMCFLMFGCATSQISKQAFLSDPVLKASASSLAEDYLNGQIKGEDGAKFGMPVNFLNLHDWKIYEADYLWDGNYANTPAVYCRLKTENQMGGIGWSDYIINMDYDASLRAQGDKYNGLRIRMVRKT